MIDYVVVLYSRGIIIYCVMEYDGTVHREKPLEQKKTKKNSIACLCHNADHQCGQNSEMK